MKVLYIGHYRQASGWGQAARDYILAMDSVGIDVVARPFPLNGPQTQITPKLEKIEQRSAIGCDVCIQHILPHHLSKENFKKNIGLVALETSHYNYTSWPTHMNLMDEIWFPCGDLSLEAKQNGIKVPTRTVQHTFNFSKYENAQKINIAGLSGKFAFYTIGEMHHRKNLEALITAFHSEFDRSEPVALVLKLSKPGMSEEQLDKYVAGVINEIKTNLRKYPDITGYNRELLITTYISEAEILALHKTCDCFVLPSRGEAWSVPLFDALALGNYGIAADWGGPVEYLDSNYLVPTTPTVCEGVIDTFPGICTCREQWREVIMPELMRTMRQVYEKRPDISVAQTNRLQQFSYENIGNKIKGILDEFSS